MKKIITLCFFTLLINELSAQVSNLWASRYSSSGANTDRATAMVTDASGNVYITGTGWGTGSSYDYVTVKFNNNGTQLWVAKYDTTNGYDEAKAIAVDGSGNVYVTGYSYGSSTTGYDYATVKYNSSGTQVWAKRYYGTGSGFDEANAIAVDASGNVYVTGGVTRDTTVTFPFPMTTQLGTDYATLKYNSSGVQQWVKHYHGTSANNTDEAYALVLDASANVYVTGYSYGGTTTDYDIATIKYNTSGTPQWNKRYNGSGSAYDAATCMAIDAASNIYVAGSIYGGSSNKDDYAVVKYSKNGGQLHVITYNGSGSDNDKINAILVDASANVYFTGKSIGSGTAGDIATLKYDTALTVKKWEASYDGSANKLDEGQGLAVDASGNLFVTGYSYNNSSNNDFTTLKYNSTGVQQWVAFYNGPGNNTDQAVGVSVDASGYVYVGGVSRGGSGTADDYALVKHCQFTANAGTDVSICPGGTSQLTASATGAVSFKWKYNTSLSDSTIANPIASPAATTSYIVTITNSAGCSDVDTVIVTVNTPPVPSITASASNTICQGDSAKLTSSTASSYLWSTSATGSAIWVKNAGTYKVTVSDGIGCTGSTQVTVSVNPLPSSNAGPDRLICGGGSKDLAASGGISYFWTPSTGLDDVTIPNPSASPISTTTYTVKVTNANGCIGYDATIVKVDLSPPDGSIVANGSTTFCQGSSVKLNASMADHYSWSTGATADSIIVSVSGTYSLTQTNNSACSATAQVTIVINPLPTANAGPDLTICSGKGQQLSGSGGTSYQWSPATGLNNVAIANPTATPAATSTYTLLVTDANGCTNNDNVIVQVNPTPSGVITAGGPTTFCKGGSVKLKSSKADLYSWNNGVTVDSIIVSTAGTYTLTQTNTGGCTATAKATVTVNPLPTANAGSDQLICGSGSKSLSGSGGGTYKWSPASGLNNTIIASPTANPTVTTTYTLVVTNTNGCTGNDEVIVNVDKNAPSGIITAGSSTTFCQGGTVKLKASKADFYSWSTTATVDSIIVASSGTYTLTQTNNSGCSATAKAIVQVNPLPTVSAGPDQAICNGGVGKQLSGSGSGTYKWAPATGLSSTIIANPTANPSITTTYTLTVTGSNGCTNRDSVKVGVGTNPPIPTISYNSSVLSSSLATSYQWYFNGSLISGATSQTYTPTQNGNYTVEVFNSSGCSATSTAYNITDVGIAERENTVSFNLYPNPARDKFFIEIQGESKNANIRIINALGQLVHNEYLNGSGSKQIVQINTTVFTPGVYLVSLEAENGRTVKRLVVE